MAHTLKNVAEAAGVSPATASIVLNGRAKGRVSEEVANRVIATAKELNYHPNLTARSLRTQESKTIGLISDQIATTPFASQMLAGAQMEAVKEHWLLFVVNADGDKEVEFSASRALIQNNVSGFIYASMYHREVSIPKTIADRQVVLLDCFDKAHAFDSVVPAEYKGGRVATEYLIANGHKKIAHITDSNNSVASPERLRGFKDVLIEKKIAINDSYILRTPGSNSQDGYVMTQKLLALKDRPTAIFAYNDRMAFGAYEAIQENGLEVGRDISVIGFDDHDIAQYIGLTTVSQPPQFEGQVAAAAAIAEVTHRTTEHKNILVPLSLVVRETTAKI